MPSFNDRLQAALGSSRTGGLSPEQEESLRKSTIENFLKTLEYAPPPPQYPSGRYPTYIDNPPEQRRPRLPQKKTVLSQDEEASWTDRAQDLLIDTTKGAVGLSSALVGAADMFTGNMVGDGLGYIGYKPKETTEILNDLYSDARKAENKRIDKAQGFTETAGALWDNPGAALGKGVEAIPMNLAKNPLMMALIEAGYVQSQARQAGKSWNESIIPSLTDGTVAYIFHRALDPKLDAIDKLKKISPEDITTEAIKRKLRAGAKNQKDKFSAIMEEVQQYMTPKEAKKWVTDLIARKKETFYSNMEEARKYLNPKEAGKALGIHISKQKQRALDKIVEIEGQLNAEGIRDFLKTQAYHKANHTLQTIKEQAFTNMALDQDTFDNLGKSLAFNAGVALVPGSARLRPSVTTTPLSQPENSPHQQVEASLTSRGNLKVYGPGAAELVKSIAPEASMYRSRDGGVMVGVRHTREIAETLRKIQEQRGPQMREQSIDMDTDI